MQKIKIKIEKEKLLHTYHTVLDKNIKTPTCMIRNQVFSKKKKKNNNKHRYDG